ncbi:hypothetical protein JG687_00015958 [Phytophthora cactorum]|uniref:Uncharacterized protein n=1 Tax=Phytophthora cactorum TaxID=29920 RepID=A0A8T1TVL2_9STRA|nr:hypothetical protein JG687_00015958 [Phytophthora cactorum]
MPKQSERQILLREIVNITAVVALEEEDDDKLDGDSLSFQNYTTDTDFREMTWMDKASFERIVNEIKDHPVFQNKSYCSQATVWSRLAVALDRLGNYGNEASLNRSKRLWGGGGGLGWDGDC